MSNTPERKTASIRRITSPRSPGSPANVASLRVGEAANNIVEHHRKWLQAVDKGALFCSAIKNIRKNILPTTNEIHPYPENLLIYCRNLSVMVTIMNDVIEYTESIMTQMASLSKFFSEQDIIGQTWNYYKFINTIQQIIRSYKLEISLRKYVSENIGHTLSQDQLSLFVTHWKHHLDTERDRELLIKMMIYEFNLSP